MPMLTAIGAFSQWPSSSFLGQLGQNELVRWLFVFILIMQGGGGGNATLSAVATLVVYVVVKALDMVFAKKEMYY
tara:strand:- start:4283 stop:4507 length:225 start_codon:yes stop_codon:yes gene_type:complete